MAWLRAAIDSHIARFEAEEHSELVQERALRESFAEERRRAFRGRYSNLAAIAGYLAGNDATPWFCSVLQGSASPR